MNKSPRAAIRSLPLVLALLTAPLCTHAALLAYEGFDYTANTSIAAQSGGTGWTNVWASGGGPGLATNVAGSLGYTDVNGRSLQTSGGSLVIGNPGGTTAVNATPNRAFPGNLSGGTNTVAGPGATNWISLLYQRLNFIPGPYFRQANLGLFEASGERVAIGAPNTNPTNAHVLSVWGNSGVHVGLNSFQSTNHPITPGSTYFILIKVITDNVVTSDTAYVWFNWTNLLVEPSVGTADIVQNEVNLSSVNTLRLQAGNANASGSNAVWQADELRLGTTFSDVTPNVASLAAPSINSQPASQTVTIGDPATFTVNAGGATPLFYQWLFNTNTPLLNQTNDTLNFISAQTNDAGTYSVQVTNSVGAITSAIVTLTVLPPAPPAITTQPASFALVAGETASFSVTATGYAPLRYQWRFNNAPLANETNSFLNIFNTTTNNSGNYTVVVTNSVGAITSAPGNLNVIYAGPAGLPAFPGADGAAKFISGGRGGLVYHVTMLDRNMNHSEAGTLRYGLTDGNFPAGVPRTIVFDVAGTFWLGRYGAESNHMHGWDTASRYNLSSRTTIAGQTAPGPVFIMGGVTKASAANIIVRNVTFAPGYGLRSFAEPPAAPVVGDFPDSYVYDALDISGQRILLDHLTAIYITDEAISCNELAATLTVQHCNISQGQNYPQADAESTNVTYTGHALAHLLQAGTGARVSILNNLYAHQKGRLPRVGSEIGTGATNDFRNNVFYNWLGTAGTGASGQSSFNNFINNFYLAGPGGDNPAGGTNYAIVNASGGTSLFDGSSAASTRAFVVGNSKDTNKDGDANDPTSADASFTTITTNAAAYDTGIGVTLYAANALLNVLRHVGSRWWERDFDFALNNTNAINTVDERLIHETWTGTGKIMAWADDPFNSDPSEGVEWRSLLALRADPVTFAAPFNRPGGWDTDGDGMPDAWENLHGLNPAVANNNSDFDSDGFTDLEEYLNEVAAWPAPGVILFTGATSSRYAEIFNWRVNGQPVNITGQGTVTTFSPWQPSRYDSALISNITVTVDAVGQNAGTLLLTDGATLNITNGWLKIADTLSIGVGCTAAVGSGATLNIASNLINSGTLRLTGSAAFTVGGSFTNTGTLDVMTWSGTLPGGFVNNGTLLTRNAIQITSAGAGGTNFSVTLQGYVGHNYQLEYRNALGIAPWVSVGTPVAGAGAPIVLTHPGGSIAQQRFYRVAVNP